MRLITLFPIIITLFGCVAPDITLTTQSVRLHVTGSGGAIAEIDKPVCIVAGKDVETVKVEMTPHSYLNDLIDTLL